MLRGPCVAASWYECMTVCVYIRYRHLRLLFMLLSSSSALCHSLLINSAKQHLYRPPLWLRII